MTQKFRSHRYPAATPVYTETKAGKNRAQILDVNEAGARLSGLKDLLPGEMVKLQLGHEQVAGYVRWCHGTLVGLSFQPRLTLSQVDGLRNTKSKRGRTRWTPGSANLSEIR